MLQKPMIRTEILLFVVSFAFLMSCHTSQSNADSVTGDPNTELILSPMASGDIERSMQDDFIYFIMPDRFANGDTSNDLGGYTAGVSGYNPADKGYYHGGDLKGVRSKLDYLQGLGVTALWLTPIFANKPVQGDSAAYHGYWILDFLNVDSHLGTNEDLKNLIADLHSRNMKLYIDIVINHTADVISYKECSDCAYRPSSQPPYTPVLADSEKTAKNPAWLNNTSLYHNQGNSTFSGESSLRGDFFGLDDLATENEQVVSGMIEIYKHWVKEYQVDGFRIDTYKHVHQSFWQQFNPALYEHAQQQGIKHFFMYGEVFDFSPETLSSYVVDTGIQAVLDFGFFDTVKNVVINEGDASKFRALISKDSLYLRAGGDAYQLPLFLGSHDKGRAAYFLSQNPFMEAEEDQLQVLKMLHFILFTFRGVPVVYYGDEQGFTGDGGDKDARQDMFPSKVASYNNDNLIGTDKTTADDNFDTTHPLYQAISQFAKLRQEHRALRRGYLIHRHTPLGSGVIAYSRVDPVERVEYVAAFNTLDDKDTGIVPTYSANTQYVNLLGEKGQTLQSDANGNLSIELEMWDFILLKSSQPLDNSVDLNSTHLEKK